jgi:hypothetical protein
MAKHLLTYSTEKDFGVVHNVSRITITPEQGIAIAKIFNEDPDLLTDIHITGSEAVLITGVEK